MVLVESYSKGSAMIEYWKRTGSLKPFKEVADFETWAKELIEFPNVELKRNTPTKRATAKKGMALGVKYDSFAEYTFMRYQELIKHSVVERNQLKKFLTYIDDDCKQRKWYPDFIVNGVFYEVKGIMRPKDVCKKAQHPEVEWIFMEDTKKEAKELDEAFPDWRSEFVQTR
jgi:hypothetical protein